MGSQSSSRFGVVDSPVCAPTGYEWLPLPPTSPPMSASPTCPNCKKDESAVSRAYRAFAIFCSIKWLQIQHKLKSIASKQQQFYTFYH